ncbi:MAG TPA: MFS transporter [Erwinia sp.]|nr:MFS transporter [Erwinia sp.]
MKLFLKGTAGRLFIINGLTALSYAFILPVMSTFLVEGLKAQPTFITLYSIGFATSGIVFNQWMGKMVDQGHSNKKLFICSLIAIFLSALAFLLCHNAWQALLTGLFLMGPGNASVPLLLSMIRHYSVNAGENATRLNSQMRAGVSLVWIAGPALAFIMADAFGFRFNFIASALLAGCVIIYSVFMLDPAQVQPVKSAVKEVGRRAVPAVVWLLGGVIVLSNLANHLYITAMPLYILREIKLPGYFPGLLLGMTALLEIPVMLIASGLSERYGKFKVMLAGFCFGLVYYSLLQLADSMVTLLLLQCFNALFYGVFVGLGVTIIQEALPEKRGFSSAFYSNSMRVGMMLGTSLAGILAQLYSFRVALLAPVASISLAALLILWVALSSASQKLDVARANDI